MNKTIFPIIFLIIFGSLFFAGVSIHTKSITESEQSNTFKISQITAGVNVTWTSLIEDQELIDFTNDGLFDVVLFKTELTTDADLLVMAALSTSWTTTKTGTFFPSGQGISLIRMFIPVGTHNITLFFGLNSLLRINELNTTVSLEYNLSLSLSDTDNNIVNNSFNFPTISASFNSSLMSDAVSEIRLFSPVEQMFLHRMGGKATYYWHRGQFNWGAISNNIGLVHELEAYAMDNGTITMQITDYNGMFTLGRNYDTSNLSFTTQDVPVGYPFSVLKLPNELTDAEFKLLQSDRIGNSTFGTPWTFSFDSNSTHLVYRRDLIQSSIEIYLSYIYERSSGVLVYGKQDMILSGSQYLYEEVVRVDRYPAPLDAPVFITQSYGETVYEQFNIEWTPVNDASNYLLYMNGTLVSNTSSTSFLYQSDGNALYIFTLMAVNLFDGAESSIFLTNPVLVTVNIPPDPPAIPDFITQDQTVPEYNFSISWTASDNTQFYLLMMNGTIIANTTSTTFWYESNGNGTYVFTVIAANLSTGHSPFISHSVPVTILVSIPTPTTTTSTTSTTNDSKKTVNPSNTETTYPFNDPNSTNNSAVEITTSSSNLIWSLLGIIIISSFFGLLRRRKIN
ncbi:MAG: hypothetical protein HeimC3_14050 [Candidatus Heimdallarchaeota archaeon LC_3]|nr:MAG: hypothetical protein HeimC3_14050 [Candidatus Heimdallarchaeota archaeon LC_3]